jgi:hypothetical protein
MQDKITRKDGRRAAGRESVTVPTQCLFLEREPWQELSQTLDANGTAAPARTGDPQIHNLVL